MKLNIKIFAALTLLTLLTISTLKADETYYWIHFRQIDGDQSYPIYALWGGYEKADQRKLCKNTSQALTNAMRPEKVEYICVDSAVHTLEMAILRKSNPDWDTR